MIAALLLLLAGAAEAPSANEGPAVCPDFEVFSSAPREGVLSFVLVSIGAPEDITYNWLISTGTIVAGQGTLEIEVAAEVGSFVTASVDIGGVPEECPSFISASDEVFE